jgi:hypothetical protein
MSDKLLGSERVLHEGAGYRSKFKAARRNPLPGSRGIRPAQSKME